MRGRDYSKIERFTRTIGEHGEGHLQFNDPMGMTIDHRGNIYVADSLNNRIQCFSSDETFLFQFGEDKLWSPNDICFDSAHLRLIVNDFLHHRIALFDLEGKFLFAFGSAGNGNGQFNTPSCIAIDARGHILVSDYANHCVQMFDSDGQFLMVIGGGKLEYPTGIAFLSNGNFVVAEDDARRISIFSPPSEPWKVIRRIGKKELSRAYHLHIDARDNILLTDSTGFLFIFTPTNELIKKIYLSYRPNGVVVDARGNILVSCVNDEIYVY